MADDQSPTPTEIEQRLNEISQSISEIKGRAQLLSDHLEEFNTEGDTPQAEYYYLADAIQRLEKDFADVLVKDINLLEDVRELIDSESVIEDLDEVIDEREQALGEIENRIGEWA